MGAIQTLKDNGSEFQILSVYDAAVYDVACGGDCVCGGIGNAFQASTTEGSLRVSFSAGSQAIIGGNFFRVKEAVELLVPPNSVSYICARIDTTQIAGSTGSIVALAETDIQKENINGAGTTRDLVLYKVTTTTSSIQSIDDMRNIRTASGTAIGNYSLWVGTEAMYNAITTKDDNTLYFIKE